MKFEKLGNIAKITSGGTPLTSRREYYDNGTIPWVKTGDLKVRHLKNIPDKITKAGLENSSAKIFPVNTVLVAMYGATIGACSILKTEAATNQACAAILPTEKANEEYLYFFLTSIRTFLINKGVGGGQPNISATILKEIKIPVPPKPLQIQIANLLSKAEDLIKQRKESIELLDKFLESTFYEMFGDPTVGHNLEKVGEHLILNGGAAFKSTDFVDEGIPVIKIGTVNKGFFDTKTLSFLPESFLTNFERYIIRPGDLLLSLTGTVGKDDYGNACFVTSDYDSYLLNQRVAKINVDEAFLNLHFVYYLFKFPKFKNSLIKANRGVRQANLSNNDIYNIRISYPPIQEQIVFASIVLKAEALKKDFTESLMELENLFGSLNQRAFKGELEFKNILEKEIGDPLEGMDLPKDKLPGLDDILKQAGDKAEVVTEEKKKEKEKSTSGSPFESISTVAGSISNYKPVLEDVQPFIQKTFRDNYFSFENLKQATVKAGWQYDFETLKSFVFALLRKGQLKQVFADAAFKSSFKESDADFKKIKELNEQMYLQQAAISL